MASTPSFTDRVLLVIADLADLHRIAFSVSRAQAAMSGDPRWRKTRPWLEKVLQQRAQRQKLHGTMYALWKNGYLRRRAFREGVGYLLTPKGEWKILQLRWRTISKRKLPGNQWLMVFFDIPEPQRRKRDWFREMLRLLKFQQLQRSIWVTPFAVTQEVTQLIRELELGRFVQALVVKPFTGLTAFRLSKRKDRGY